MLAGADVTGYRWRMASALAAVDPQPIEDLVEALREARLPEPRRRRAIRVGAGASLRDVGGVLGVSAMTVKRWEEGAVPRRDRAAAYRKLLHALEHATR